MEQLFAAAQEWQGLAGPDSDVATIGSLASLITNIINAVVMLSGVVLFVMLLSGGMSYLLSGGDQKKLEKAKGTLTGAFIGLLVIVSGYLILKLISVITGVDVTQFVLEITS